MIGILFILARTATERFFAVSQLRIRLQASDIEPSQITEKTLKLTEADLQGYRNLSLGGIASKPALAVEDCLFQSASLASQRPRAPIHLAQAIEDSPANSELGVILQLN